MITTLRLEFSDVVKKDAEVLRWLAAKRLTELKVVDKSISEQIPGGDVFDHRVVN